MAHLRRIAMRWVPADGTGQARGSKRRPPALRKPALAKDDGVLESGDSNKLKTQRGW